MTKETNTSSPETLAMRNQALLRAEDHDRFLISLLAPKDQRSGLVALYALNVEIAKTRYVVSEPALGEIRLAWWREAVTDMLAGNVRRHDILEELTGASLDEAALHGLVDARQADLYREPMANMEALIAYAVDTSGQLEGIAAAMIGGDMDQQVNARKVGTAWALVGLMRALPHNLGQGPEQQWNYLPADRIAESGLVDPLSAEADQRQVLCEIVAGVCDVAQHLLEEAKEGEQTAASKLLAVLCRSYLKTFAKAAYDPFAANFEKGAFGRLLQVGWAGLRL
jgi:phytoene/squalene synthetase